MNAVLGNNRGKVSLPYNPAQQDKLFTPQGRNKTHFFLTCNNEVIGEALSIRIGGGRLAYSISGRSLSPIRNEGKSPKTGFVHSGVPLPAKHISISS
jgi:hypothetical protein